MNQMARRGPFTPSLIERLIVYALLIPVALLFLVASVHDRRHNLEDG